MSSQLAVRGRVLLALAVAVAGVWLPTVGAQAQAPEVTEYEGEAGTVVQRGGDGLVPSRRYRGASRHDTARLIATDTDAFVDADHVLVARADDFPDSLAGAALAGARTAPVLLVDPAAGVAPATRAALDTIEPSTVSVLGGTQAVSGRVADDLADLASVDAVNRVAGADRFATAAAVARAAADAGGVGELDGQTTALLSTGDDFADALAGGQAAYAGPFPLLLTPGDELGAAAETALADLGIDRVVVLGGAAAVADDVVDALDGRGYDVDRLAGDDRTATAVAVADFAVDELGFADDHVNVARGNDFADALAIGPHAGAEQAPLLISATESRIGHEHVAGFNAARGCSLEGIHAAGGFAALSPALEQDVRITATGAACDVAMATGEQLVAPGESTTVEADVLTSVGESSTGGVDVAFDTAADTAGDDAVACTPADAVTDDDGRASCIFDADAPGLHTVTATVTTDEGDEVRDTTTVAVGDLDPAGTPDADAETLTFSVASSREVGEGYEADPNPLGPAGGDANGVARLSVDPTGGEVCVSMVAAGVAGDAAAFEDAHDVVPVHLHAGGVDENGEVVVGFADPPSQLGPLTLLNEACEPVDQLDLLADVVADPGGYYLNVHTDVWPGGNVRGQLDGAWDGTDRTDDAPADPDADDGDGGFDLPLL